MTTILPTGLTALEEAAEDVIGLLKTIPELAEAKIAIIGGMAIVKYLKEYRTTEDVDFIITVKNAPNYVKEKLLQLPNTPFVQMAKFFVYKTPTGTEIQIDICSSELSPFLPGTARTISTIQAGEPLPYIEINDLLVFKIHSCGLRAEFLKKKRDALDATVLLDRLTSDGPLKLDDEQKRHAEGGLQDMFAVLGITNDGDINVWKKKLGM